MSLLLVLSSGVTAAGPDDCQLNGVCSNGHCVCDAGWVGDSCEQLSLGQSSTAIRYDAAPLDGGAWTWGGSPILDDSGNWHLLFSAMVNGCGLLHYQSNSVVKHAVAKSLQGPWSVTGTALSPRPGEWDSGGIHGPSVRRDPISRDFLLFYEATHRSSPPLDCIANASLPPVDVSHTRRIGVARAASPVGPWERLDEPILSPRGAAGAWDSNDVSNAAPLLLPNGTALLGYRAGGDGVALGGGIGVAAAASWRGPYRRLGASDRRMQFAAEDGAMWADSRGGVHMLVHRFAAANGSTSGTAVGGHGWSADGGLTWRYAAQQEPPTYTSSVTWRNGTRATLYRRERPKPVLDATGRLTALFNGAWPCHHGAEDDDTTDGAAGCYSFTMVTELI